MPNEIYLCIVSSAHTSVHDRGDERHAARTYPHPERPAEPLRPRDGPVDVNAVLFRRFDGEDDNTDAHDQNWKQNKRRLSIIVSTQTAHHLYELILYLYY